MKRQFSEVDVNTEVIVGAKIVDRGFCQEDEYHSMLRKICDNCSAKVLYIPHRGESSENKAKLASLFPRIQMLDITIPIESWLGQQTCPPATFHGYVSTAFYIINLCYPQIDLKCYRPSEQVINKMSSADVYGSNRYNYAQVTKLIYDKLPKSVDIIYL
jgi:hypothetical protein